MTASPPLDWWYEMIPAGAEPLECFRCRRVVYRATVASPFPGDAATNLRVDPDVPGGRAPTATEPGRGWVHVRVCGTPPSTPEAA